MATWGCPIKISDSAKTFKSAAKTIQRVMAVVKFSSNWRGLGQNRYSIWREHLGGVAYLNIWSSPLNFAWRKQLAKAKLTYDELLTALTEVEMILNSRPLFYVSKEDIEQSLTPSHLMTGRSLLSLLDAVHYKTPWEDSDLQCLMRLSIRGQNILTVPWPIFGGGGEVSTSYSWENVTVMKPVEPQAESHKLVKLCCYKVTVNSGAYGN